MKKRKQMNEIKQGAGGKGGFRRLRILGKEIKNRAVLCSSGGSGWRGDT